jgi:hypothetical protein
MKNKIVLASCDQKYYDLYGATFEKSLKKLDQPYHIEICDPTPPSDWVDAKPGHIIGMNKTWYACKRYLILPEMIEEHGGVFVADIDAVFFKPIPFPKQAIGRVKTSPKSFRSEWEQKGMHVMAGHFYCQDVDIAVQIRDKILELPKRWFVDQVAIHEVMMSNKDKLKNNIMNFYKPPTRVRDITENDFAIMPRGKEEQKTEFRKSINTIIELIT